MRTKIKLLTKYLMVVLIFMTFNFIVKAQVINAVKNVTTKTILALNNNVEATNTKIDKQTIKYLYKIEKQEKKLQRKIAKLDSIAAAQLFAQSKENYEALENKLTNKATALKANKITQYIPGLDSMVTGLQFIKDNNLATTIKNGTTTVEKSLQAYQQLQSKLEVTKQISSYLKQRKELLQSTLEKYNVTKYLKKYNKAAYYYTAQINEYKAALKDPIKAEKLILATLLKIPKFKEYFAQFSVLGQLFPMPQNGATNIANLAGLQTRAQVMQVIQTNFGGSGTGPNGGVQALQQNIQEAQQELQKLKNKVSENIGGGDADFNMPNFTPNNQKGKSFLKRLELKTDLQTNKGNGLLPNIADVAVGLGYKMDDKKIVGVQVAYKLGLGNGLENIKLTTEGFSYRTYADMKFKKNFWLTGGYELTNFSKISPLSLWRGAEGEVWSKSALLGLSKKYSISKKRKGEAKILYNFLWQQQPNAQKIIFRTGLNF